MLAFANRLLTCCSKLTTSSSLMQPMDTYIMGKFYQVWARYLSVQAKILKICNYNIFGPKSHKCVPNFTAVGHMYCHCNRKPRKHYDS